MEKTQDMQNYFMISRIFQRNISANRLALVGRRPQLG